MRIALLIVLQKEYRISTKSGYILLLARDLYTKGGGIQLIKYSADGQLIWVKHHNGSASNMYEPSTFAIDAQGNSYVVGIFSNASYYLAKVTIKFSKDNPNQLEQLYSQNQLKFWPTITQGTIYMQSPSKETTIIEVFSTDGTLAYKNRLTSNHPVIHLINLEKGLYYVKLSNKEVSQISKIIVKK